MDPKAWSFLTVDGERQYGGNDGYSDDPLTLYRYDSDVANHLQVRAGDLAVIRSKSAVLGMASVEEIVTGTAPKQRLRCPTCGSTNIKRRKTMSPPWRCKRNHGFSDPAVEHTTVTTYEARYGKTFTPTAGLLTVSDLHNAVRRPSDQMSIKELDPVAVEARVGQEAALRSLFEDFALMLTDDALQSGSTDDDQDTSSVVEARRKVLREIAVRRGQARFRQRLVQRYGAKCQVSGCDFIGLVEAAHLRPFSQSGDNSVQNGLLLRSDLHTLFDLGLLGIRPKLLTVSLHPALHPAGYANLDGAKLHINGSAGPSSAALEERWEFYLKRCAKGSQTGA